MSKHTPGPWRIGANSVMNGVQILKDYDGVRQYSVPVCSMPPTGRDRSANARLIAAAPDLLAALIQTESWLREFESGPDSGVLYLLTEVRAAIAKAKGE